VYALGATMHALVTGSAPFDAPDIPALRDMHVGAPYVPPTARTPREAYVFAMMAQMLAKRPEDRYGTAEEVARALEQIAGPPPPFVLREPCRALVGNV